MQTMRVLTVLIEPQGGVMASTLLIRISYESWDLLIR